MSHFVCNGGCKGVSDNEGVCQTETCSLHNQPLSECNCEGGKEAHAAPAEEKPAE